MNTIQQKIISNKLGLLNLAEELQNVSKACKIMGYSRDTFYRYKELKDEGGVVEEVVENEKMKVRIEDAPMVHKTIMILKAATPSCVSDPEAL